MATTNMANGGSSSSKDTDLHVRQVWAHNLRTELCNMVDVLNTGQILWVSMDTEFPGTVFGKYTPHAPPSYVYQKLKSNVDNTNIIQLGLTLANSDGSRRLIWQFNFKDFNLHRGDRHNSASIKLLGEHGIDFTRNAEYGIDSRLFGQELVKVMRLFGDNVAWVGFHCGVDFAYMIKMLTGQPLPAERSDFMGTVREFFGHKIFDMKYIMKDCCPGLRGGLESIAKALKVDCVGGTCHQAGYDSFLTMQTFHKMKMLLRQPAGENTKNNDIQGKYGNKIFGLYDGKDYGKREEGNTNGYYSMPSGSEACQLDVNQYNNNLMAPPFYGDKQEYYSMPCGQEASQLDFNQYNNNPIAPFNGDNNGYYSTTSGSGAFQLDFNQYNSKPMGPLYGSKNMCYDNNLMGAQNTDRLIFSPTGHFQCVLSMDGMQTVCPTTTV